MCGIWEISKFYGSFITDYVGDWVRAIFHHFCNISGKFLIIFFWNIQKKEVQLILGHSVYFMYKKYHGALLMLLLPLLMMMLVIWVQECSQCVISKLFLWFSFLFVFSVSFTQIYKHIRMKLHKCVPCTGRALHSHFLSSYF